MAQTIRAAKHSEFYSLGLVLGYDYAGSPIVWTEERPAAATSVSSLTTSARAGARLPHAWLGEQESLYDLLGPEFSIVTFGAPADAFQRAADRCGVPLVAVDLGARRDLRGRYGADLLLVRPDQHVAWRGDDSAHADEILARALGH